MPNLLASEKSLYLRQHGDNPVDWRPWGPDALAAAREANKPLLLSIGYSSCHWCHVMAHESFEDEYIAGIMNEHFVCVKIDREERPDLDKIYMEAVQMLNGQGGWPLNVFCLPDGRPFAGGTYFPPTDRGQGLIPWPQLLVRISNYYHREREKLEENAQAILQNMETAGKGAAAAAAADEAEGSLGQPQLLAASHAICSNHDDEWGGFGGAPKFPPSMTLNYLLEMRNTASIDERDPSFARRIDQVAQKTLDGMALGGIYDQIGGGFARYSVDRYWRIPHFEKMLYDNALLLDIFTKGWLRYRKPLYRAVVEETIGWLEREMRSPAGGYYSSLDADSEGVEGKFQVWNAAQVKEILGQGDGDEFCRFYGITEEGNFEHGFSNPVLAADDFEKRQAMTPLREKMLRVRQQRVGPGKDLKQLTSWNSLLIRGLAEAGFYMGQKDWLRAARHAADWIWEHLRFGEDRLHAANYEGEARLNGYLDDYAFYAEALLSLAAKIDWMEEGAGQTYIDRARILVDSILRNFADPGGQPGFFFTSGDHERLVHRQKEWWDNPIPCGNSSLIHCFSCLYALTGEARYQEEMENLRTAYPVFAQRYPGGIAHALAGYTADAIGIVVIKKKGPGSLDVLQQTLADKPWRRTFIISTQNKAQPEGFQLCVGTRCLAPAAEPETLLQYI